MIMQSIDKENSTGIVIAGMSKVNVDKEKIKTDERKTNEQPN